MKLEEMNFAQKKAKDFNFLTRIFQILAVNIIFYNFIGNLFYKIKTERNKNLKKDCAYIFAPNHISYFDVFLVNIAANRLLAYMAKQELFSTKTLLKKFLTILILDLGGFAVNRQKPAISTIKTVKEVFKKKCDLCIFPQGGIKKNKTIEDINGGFIYFAKSNKVDIVPVSLCGMEEYNWKLFKRKPVNVKVGTPISYELPEEEIIKEWAKQICDFNGYKNTYL